MIRRRRPTHDDWDNRARKAAEAFLAANRADSEAAGDEQRRLAYRLQEELEASRPSKFRKPRGRPAS